MTRPEFKVHKLNADGLAKAKLLADTFTDTIDCIERICGTGGREMAIVRTKLEEASFFAKKAMASQAENQATDT